MTDKDINLINEKLHAITSLINVRFELTDEKLETVYKEQLRTNGRVLKTETQIAEALLERVTNREQQKYYSEQLCNNTNDIISLKKEFEDVRFILKYPKLFVAAIVVVTVLTLATFLSNNPLKVFDKEPTKTEQTQQNKAPQ